VQLTWLPSVRALVGAANQISGNVGEEATLKRQSLLPLLPFLDIAELTFGLERFKAEHGLERLHVDRQRVRELSTRDDWYVLHAQPEDVRPDRLENRRQWHRMAEQLLCKYCMSLYRHLRGLWEAPYLEVVELNDSDRNLVDRYTVEATGDPAGQFSPAKIEPLISDLLAQIATARATRQAFRWEYFNGRWKVLPLEGHLYQPLLHVGKGVQVRVSPVALNESEAMFVEDLDLWCKAHPEVEVHLLRNKVRDGLGFFRAGNYFPDFFLWVRDEAIEHLAFVDPHGLRHTGIHDPKIRFATQEVPRLQQLIGRQPAAANLRVHAWIISPTRYNDLTWATDTGAKMAKPDIEALHVLFQQDDRATYIDKMMRAILTGAAQAGSAHASPAVP